MNSTNIRVMLVDNTNGRYIKSLYDSTFSDFLNLIISSKESNNKIVTDFRSILEYFYKELDIKFKQLECRELKIKIKTIYDSWEELQSIKKTSFYEQKASMIQNDCKTAINWLFLRIGDFEAEYKSLNFRKEYNIQQQKKLKLEKDFSNDIDSFIQILLCYIHTMCKMDIKYFKTDTLLSSYCSEIKLVIVNLLKEEVGYHSNYFRNDSPIYYYCFNSKNDIDVELLLNQVSHNQKISEIITDKLTPIIVDSQNSQKMEIDFSWIVPGLEQTKRVRILSEYLQKIDNTIDLLNKLKDDNIQYNNDINLELNIKQYIENKTNFLS